MNLALLAKKKQEQFLALDIGSSSIKVLCLEVNGNEAPRLKIAAIAPLAAGAVTNNAISKPEVVSNTLKTLLETNEISATKVAFSLPGPAVFTKKITLTSSKLEAFLENIQFEAANYIPHKIEAVHLDYQVLPSSTAGSSDIILVAAKNEVVLSFVDAIEQAGLEPAIGDVDYFAMENAFELNYPEAIKQTVALVDIGSRYSGVNILQDGRSLFTGDVGVGGRTFTDALCESLSMQVKQAEDAKFGKIPDGFDAALVAESLERTCEHVVGEIQRQISFFWNASGTDRPIEAIYLAGGASGLSGLVEELRAKAGITVDKIEPFKKINTKSGFDPEYLKEIDSQMVVCVGLALRKFGDKPKGEN
jgi:type IV pilus assembly protein PilM